MEPLHDKLERLTRRRGLKQADLVRVVPDSKGHLPCNKAQVSRWFSGAAIPDVRQALALARALDVPVAYLIDDAAEEPAPVSQTRERIEDLIEALGEAAAYDRLAMVDRGAAGFKSRPRPSGGENPPPFGMMGLGRRG